MTEVGPYKLPEGIVVWPMIYALQNSINNWDDPEDFNPVSYCFFCLIFLFGCWQQGGCDAPAEWRLFGWCNSITNMPNCRFGAYKGSGWGTRWGSLACLLGIAVCSMRWQSAASVVSTRSSSISLQNLQVARVMDLLRRTTEAAAAPGVLGCCGGWGGGGGEFPTVAHNVSAAAVAQIS